MSSHPSKKISPLPDDFQELEFKIEEENWNEYELNDGNRINARIILRKIVQDPNDPKKLNFDTTPPTYVVYAPSGNRGEKNNEPPPQEFMSLPTYDIKIERNNEKWNEYKILKSGQTMRLRLIVNSIKRAKDRYDKDGMPFYVINSGPMVVMDPLKKEYDGQ